MEQVEVSTQDLKEQVNEVSTDTHGVLSDKEILEYREIGKIVIEPFNIRQLCTSSYDVTLGEYYYREQKDAFENNIYNPYSKEHVNRLWGMPQKAVSYAYYKNNHNITLENVSDDDLLILVESGQTILCHTQEFIGGVKNITTMMKTRSSWGRNMIATCLCSGWSDIGYYFKFTMELRNNSHYTIPLVVGRRIAQIVFFSCGDILDKSYNEVGKYQPPTSNLEELKAAWTPECMLPKLYNDYEVREMHHDLL